jgi:hypothetical protein
VRGNALHLLLLLLLLRGSRKVYCPEGSARSSFCKGVFGREKVAWWEVEGRIMTTFGQSWEGSVLFKGVEQSKLCLRIKYTVWAERTAQ